jgi:predicted DNA-binding mobile mystery protein A
MPRAKPWSDYLALERRQLDEKLERASAVKSIDAPRNGWIKAVREALGMTSAQLARKLGVTQQAALALEKREVAGTITLATLEKAARALGCEARVVFIAPRGVDETVRARAMRKARDERNRIVHTMGLESQAKGVREVLNVEKIAESWRTTRRTRLWDDVSDDTGP